MNMPILMSNIGNRIGLTTEALVDFYALRSTLNSKVLSDPRPGRAGRPVYLILQRMIGRFGPYLTSVFDLFGGGSFCVLVSIDIGILRGYTTTNQARSGWGPDFAWLVRFGSDLRQLGAKVVERFLTAMNTTITSKRLLILVAPSDSDLRKMFIHFRMISTARRGPEDDEMDA